MLIMHVDEHEALPSSAAGSTELPALNKHEDRASSLVWQTKTSIYPSEPMQTPPLKPKTKSNFKQVFICTEVHCGKQFPRSFALRRHMRIHTGTKPYECDYEGCTQRFNTSGNLSRHKRIHSGERPYPCIFDSCGKRFNTSTKLKRHMRIHFPDGQNLFRCIGHANCNWSCDNYKEFAQHQKLHHNIIVGAQQQQQQQQQQFYAPQDQHGRAGAVAVIQGSTEKDNDYFPTADSTREYSTDHLSYGSYLGAALTDSFLHHVSLDKPKSSVLPGRNKFMGPSAFFCSSDLKSLPTMFPKDHGPDQRRMKSNVITFPSVQYSSTGGSFSISSDSTLNRPSFSNTSHFAPLRPEDERDDSIYEGPQHQMLPLRGHHVLRPPPQSNEDTKYGGFAVPPPMNPAAPEFTGEELSVVLQLMNETY